MLHLDLAQSNVGDTSGTFISMRKLQWNVIPRTRQIAVHIYVCVCVNDYPGTASQCIHMMHLYVLCISLHYVSVRGGQHFGRAGILDHSCTCSVPSICSAERGSKKYQQRRYLAQKHFVWKTSTGIRAKDESMFWALVSVLNPSPVSLVHPHLAEHCQDCTHHDDQAACRPQAEEMSQEIVF